MASTGLVVDVIVKSEKNKKNYYFWQYHQNSGCSFSFTQNEQFSNNVCKTFALKVKQKLFQEFAEKWE